MSKPEFVYVSYIRTTPEQLYRALTERVFMERYWGVVVESDWKPGSGITWEKNGVRQSDPRQVVLTADPPRRLSYTWRRGRRLRSDRDVAAAPGAGVAGRSPTALRASG